MVYLWVHFNDAQGTGAQVSDTCLAADRQPVLN